MKSLYVLHHTTPGMAGLVRVFDGFDEAYAAAQTLAAHLAMESEPMPAGARAVHWEAGRSTIDIHFVVHVGSSLRVELPAWAVDYKIGAKHGFALCDTMAEAMKWAETTAEGNAMAQTLAMEWRGKGKRATILQTLPA